MQGQGAQAVPTHLMPYLPQRGLVTQGSQPLEKFALIEMEMGLQRDRFYTTQSVQLGEREETCSDSTDGV